MTSHWQDRVAGVVIGRVPFWGRERDVVWRRHEAEDNKKRIINIRLRAPSSPRGP